MSHGDQLQQNISYNIARRFYSKHCYALSPKTKKIYHDHLDRFGLFIGDSPLTQITHHDVADFMDSLRRSDGTCYAPGYLSQIFRTIYTFFEYCLLEGWINKNPMARVPRPRQSNGPKPRLKLDQVKQLLEAATKTDLPGRNIIIILLMVDSGLRLNEVANLQMDDIDLDLKSVIVYSEKTLTRREVPINDETIEAIKAYTAGRSSGPLLLSRDNSPMTKNAVAMQIKRLKRKLNFRLYPHLLRHTFANLYNRKGDIRKLQKILGHSDIRTTARFYSDPDFDVIQAEHRAVSPLAQLKDISYL